MRDAHPTRMPTDLRSTGCQLREIEGDLDAHEPAQNDGDQITPELVDDGSNVVTVDFGKKK